MPPNGTESAQLAAVLSVIDEVLGDRLVGAYLYGSAVVGGLRPQSDLDVLAVTRRPTTRDQRAALARSLRPISRRGERPDGWRPIELTVVTQADAKPLRIPPRTDFQYGEWLREQFDAGRVDPATPNNPDLIVLLAQARRSGQPLRGPQAADIIAEVGAPELTLAMLGSLDGLLGDLDSDTANVLLTLARIWHTMTTGEFVPKDVAAIWAAARLDGTGARVLTDARAVYLGTTEMRWDESVVDARLAADAMRREILRVGNA